MKTLQIVLAMLLMSATVSAQNWSTEHYASLCARFDSCQFFTKQDFEDAEKLLKLNKAKLDSLSNIVDISIPLGESGDLWKKYLRDKRNLLEIITKIDYSKMRISNIQDNLKNDYTTLNRKCQKLLNTYQLYSGGYEGSNSFLQYSESIARLTIANERLIAVKELQDFIQTEESKLSKDAASGTYTRTWTEPINEDDIITVTAPYKTIDSIKVFDGQCVLRRTKKQYTNHTGKHFKPVTYDVTIILTVADGIVKTEKYSGSMSWWSDNKQAGNGYKTYRERLNAINNAKAIKTATKQITKYEDFGYYGNYAKEMLDMLKVGSDLSSVKKELLRKYAKATETERQDIKNEVIKLYKNYASPIKIDFSNIKR
ncbi:hypothetical protein [Bacteroides ovatus]|uniref:hypothetical protein n=1 Tax=Bacteroides ovatus TaxID=28116 RepID=UPI00189CF1DA|nr:hypothetical protein [Bacteroides ovatus]